MRDAPLATPQDLIVARAGALPLVLTAPHGGRAMAGLPARRRGVTLRDERTLELTLALAERLTAQLGASPSVVAATFSRKAIDANRPADRAFDAAAARPLYDAYHGWIGQFVAAARARFPAGALLIDIHGQGTDPRVVFRGTRDGETVRRLLGRAGVAALAGAHSIQGGLHARGYAVAPAADSAPGTQEDPRYRGGYTVATYSGPDGIDALQLELGLALREDAGFVDHLAAAIESFARAYLMAPNVD
jgi:N-formylglutamate amidohydrolase